MLPVRDDVPASRTPFIMWVLIGANLAIFAWMISLLLEDRQQAVEGIVHGWGVVPVTFTDAAARADAAPRQYFALLTSMFLHGSIAHVVLNMWVLWIFGDNVEDRMGHLRFVLFYLVTGVAAAGVHVYMHPESNIPVVGASGAVSGVMGAYLLLYPMARVLVITPIIIPVLLPAFLFIGLWFVIQFALGWQQINASEAAGVAFWAHVGGFLAGMALCPLLATKPAPNA